LKLVLLAQSVCVATTTEVVGPEAPAIEELGMLACSQDRRFGGCGVGALPVDLQLFCQSFVLGTNLCLHVREYAEARPQAVQQLQIFDNIRCSRHNQVTSVKLRAE